VTLNDDTGDKPRHLNVRGTSISWIGYRGPDAGIALVSVDNGPPVKVDTYAPVFKVQEVLFTASGLADTEHTLTITATGDKNPAASAAKIFVDAFDVVKPGKRFEDDSIMAPNTDPAVAPRVTFTAPATHPWSLSNSRVWSGGWARTNDTAGAAATFTFTGTSVSWIGCEKASAGGQAKIFLDGTFVKEVHLYRRNPIEGFQTTIFRADGLVPGPHELKIQVSSNSTSYVVIDAFDVRP
jgi:hypothetical protein